MPRKGCFPVDYETLDTKRKSKGLSWAQLAAKADLAVAIFNHWKGGGGARKHNLISVANVLGLRNFRTLVDNDVPAAELGKPETPHAQYRQLLFDGLMSQDFAAFAIGQGGFDQTDVDYFIRLTRHHELYHISLSQAERDDIHEEFCRIGMTEWIVVERGNNKGRTILAWRPWNAKQTKEAVDMRIINEQATVRRAIALRGRPNSLQDCTESRKIHASQDEVLRLMALANSKLRKEDQSIDIAIEASLELIRLDTQLHLNWAGTSPIHIIAMKMMMQEVRQAADRFVQALRYAQEKRVNLPEDMPTLQEFTANFYQGALELFDAFLTASPDNEDSLIAMDQAIEDHSRCGFCIVDKAEMLMEYIRRLHD